MCCLSAFLTFSIACIAVPHLSADTIRFGPPLDHKASFKLDGRRWTTQNSSQAWSIRVMHGYKDAVAFEVRDGDHIGRARQNNRAEILLARDDPHRIISYDKDFWAAGAVAIQSDDTSADRVPVVLMQVHDTPDAGELQSKSPPFALRLEGRDLLLTVQGDLAACSLRNSRQQRLVRIPNVSRTALNAKPQFHYWVVRLRFSRTMKGEVDFWWGGQRAVSGRNLMMGYNNAVGGYWKHGLYRSKAASERLRVVHANVELSPSSLIGRVRRPLPLQ